MAAWWLCSIGGVVSHIPVPPFSPPKRTELWHSMAPHPPDYNFPQLLTYLQGFSAALPFSSFQLLGLFWSSSPSSVATGAHFFSSFLPSFLQVWIMLSDDEHLKVPPPSSSSSSFLFCNQIFHHKFCYCRHPWSSLAVAVQTSEQQEADPQERQPHFFPELLQPFFICLGHATGASEFSHFIHSFIMCWGSSTWRHVGLRVLKVVLVLLLWRNAGRLISVWSRW